jgi:glutaminyl-tRNA synthetase
MIATGKGARAIVDATGRTQIAVASEIDPVVEQVLGENADAVARFKGGNVNVLGALVGMVMKKTEGRANPKIVSDLLRERLQR